MAVLSSSAFSLLRGLLPKSAPPLLLSHPFVRGWVNPVIQYLFFERANVSSMTNRTVLLRRDLDSAWWNTQLWLRELFPVFVHNAAKRWGILSRQQPLWSIPPPSSSVVSCDLRLLFKGPLDREPSIVSSYEIPCTPPIPCHPSPVTL